MDMDRYMNIEINDFSNDVVGSSLFSLLLRIFNQIQFEEMKLMRKIDLCVSYIFSRGEIYDGSSCRGPLPHALTCPLLLVVVEKSLVICLTALEGDVVYILCNF